MAVRGTARIAMAAVAAVALTVAAGGCGESHEAGDGAVPRDAARDAPRDAGSDAAGPATDVEALCWESCRKLNECLGMTEDCASTCAPESLDTGCRNEDELFAALEECNELPCETYLSCLETLPPCEE